jgi:hypothetical protein
MVPLYICIFTLLFDVNTVLFYQIQIDSLIPVTGCQLPDMNCESWVEHMILPN